MAQARSKRAILPFAPYGESSPKAFLIRALRNHVEAAQHLAQDPHQKEKFIHLLRTGVKRSRASWRLLRPALPESVFRGENRRLRKAAQGLSAKREREAIADTLKRLLKRTPSEKAGRPISVALNAYLAQPREEGDGGKISAHQALSTLSESLRSLEERNLEAWDWDNAQAAIESSYRKARKAYQHAEKEGRGDAHHEWRKRTKDLWYQLEALSPKLPAAELTREKLDKLQDGLGDAQDLAVLEERMARRPHAYGGKQAVADMRGMVRRENRKLGKKSLHRGRKLFGPKPRRFIRKLDFPPAPSG